MRIVRPGFTLVELITTISIIGILSSVTVVAYNGSLERSKQAKARADIAQLAKIINLASINTHKPLYQITGNEWSNAYCVYNSQYPYVPMKNLPKIDRCWTDYYAALDAISAASGEKIPTSIRDGDPWGGPYMIDENEATPSQSDPCRHDFIDSAGSNNIPFSGTDIQMALPFVYLKTCPADM